MSSEVHSAGYWYCNDCLITEGNRGMIGIGRRTIEEGGGEDIGAGVGEKINSSCRSWGGGG